MNRLDVLGLVLRVSLALAFALFGYEKVWGTDWVPIFRDIGLGDWFRFTDWCAATAGRRRIAGPGQRAGRRRTRSD